MARSTFTSMFMVFVLAALAVPLCSAGRPDGNTEDTLAAASSQDTPGEASSYFGEPALQDLRLILSFALGIMCVHLSDRVFQSDRSSAEQDTDSQQPKFEIYPYAL
mmetsp:Transcript_120315/g.340914  ORF Transcript_120315/g.340914 Transcript_120315/m.340914 type:complete len:106 (-) Transcript_120315:126-443(-)